MKKHDLRKYTKEELIWLIENVGGFGWERRIGEVLFELDYKRAMKKLDEADSHAKKAHAARERMNAWMENWSAWNVITGAM